MKMVDALAQATLNGWQDQSRHCRATMTEQVSRVTRDLLCTISVLASGHIEWSVLHLEGHPRRQHGTSTTVEAALAACDNTVAAITEALF